MSIELNHIFKINENIAKALQASLQDQKISLDSALRGYFEEINNKLKLPAYLLKGKSPKTIEGLKKEYLEDNLVIVLGAGCSIDYGMPSWNTLLQTLLAKTFQGDQSENGKSLLFAEIFQNIFGGNSLVVARYLCNEYKDTDFGFEKAIKSQYSLEKWLKNRPC